MENDIAEMIGDSVMDWLMRLARCVGYAAVAYLLLRVNTYGVDTPVTIITAIAIISISTAGAAVGRFAIGVLMVMAILLTAPRPRGLHLQTMLP